MHGAVHIDTWHAKMLQGCMTCNAAGQLTPPPASFHFRGCVQKHGNAADDATCLVTACQYIVSCGSTHSCMHHINAFSNAAQPLQMHIETNTNAQHTGQPDAAEHSTSMYMPQLRRQCAPLQPIPGMLAATLAAKATSATDS